MKIGINIPESLHSPDHLFEWVRRVDAGPFSTLGILDRVVYTNYDALITLATAAALSTRVRLMTEILVSPLRNATLLAKEIATLDVLSKGRVTLGLGVGVRPDDFAATGAGSMYKGRGKHIEEQITQMRHIWSGQTWNEDIGAIGPHPIQRNGPEIILGGFAPQAIQRVGHYADGFVTAISDPEQINTTFRSVEQSWKDAKRSGKPRLVAQIDIALETHTVGKGLENVMAYYKIMPPYDTLKAAALVTTEQQLRETIKALEQIGTDEVIFFTWSAEIEQIDRIAALIR